MLLHDPEVSVERIGRMHKHCRRSGGVEGCNDLVGNVGTFTDPGHNDASGRSIDRIDGLCELLVDLLIKLRDRFRFDCDGTPGRSNNFFCNIPKENMPYWLVKLKNTLHLG